MNNFGQALRAFLTQNNIRPVDLARAIGSERQCVNDWLKADNIELVNITALKDGLQKILKRGVYFGMNEDNEIEFNCAPTFEEIWDKVKPTDITDKEYKALMKALD